MKLLTITIILLFSFSVLAQNKKTDRETDGLKGSVKSILTERADLKKKSGKLVESARKPEEAITYDSDGNRLTWKTNDYLTGTLFDSVIYSRVDGDKVAIYAEVENPNKITADSPITNKQVKPADPRYTNKFKYKYDSKGNVSEEAWYQNDGSLWLRYVYNFTGNKREELVYSADGSLNQKYVYTLDDKGNEIEMFAYDTEKNKIDGKETYEYLEYDAKGNWTKRITSEGDEESKFVVKPREAIYRTLTYF
jgi:Txe/YoeB family toxin of Txe-Axe toxin-antitoxin module